MSKYTIIYICLSMHACTLNAQSFQSCLTLCDSMDCSLPGSSVHGLLQEEYWRGLPNPLLQGIFPTQGLNPRLLHLLHCRQILSHWATTGAQAIWKNPKLIFGDFWFCSLLWDLVNMHTVQIKMQMKSWECPMILSIPLIEHCISHSPNRKQLALSN